MPEFSALKPFLLTVVFLALGLLIMLVGEAAARPYGFNAAFIILPVFVLYNLLLARLLGLKKELRTYWGLRKSPLFIAGCLIGAMLVFVPLLSASLAGNLIPAKETVSLSLKGLLITLCIIAWEELWFRGMALNYLAGKSSPLSAAAFTSAGFALMHMMNPAMNIRAAGPNLFLASFFMCAGYLYFKSIWFSLGLHFFWNAFNCAGPLLLEKDFPAGALWGQNGILLSFMLAAGSAVLGFLLRRRITSNT